jgi:transcriptional regulator with XRE-family HTH domain
MSDYRDTLREEFRDPEYRYAYAEDFLTTYVATQIRTLREQRGMTQEALGVEIGTKQAGISRYENVHYCAWKSETLRKIARALGVRLKISFEPFGPLLNEAAEFSQESLMRPKFEDDPAFKFLDKQIDQGEGVANAANSFWAASHPEVRPSVLDSSLVQPTSSHVDPVNGFIEDHRHTISPLAANTVLGTAANTALANAA